MATSKKMDPDNNNGLVKVDKGFPVPKSRAQQRRYPWEELEVGDSFFAQVAIASVSQGKMWARLKHPDRQFTARTVVENGIKGTRVWRTA